MPIKRKQCKKFGYVGINEVNDIILLSSLTQRSRHLETLIPSLLVHSRCHTPPCMLQGNAYTSLLRSSNRLWTRASLVHSYTWLHGNFDTVLCGICPKLSKYLLGIAYYVKELVIQFSFRQGDFTLHGFFSQPAVLDILHVVHREGRPFSLTFNLLINPRKEYVKPHGWNNLPDVFRSVFTSLIQLPSVTSLAVDWLDDLPRDLVGSGSLETLSLMHSRSPPSATSHAGMKTLTTDHMYTFDGTNGHCGKLQEAEVFNVSPEDFIQSWKIMQAASNNLHSLTIIDAFREKTENFMAPISAMDPKSFAVRDTPSLEVIPNLQQLKYSALDIGHVAPFPYLLPRLFNVAAPYENLHCFNLEVNYGKLIRYISDALEAVASTLPLWFWLDGVWTSDRFPALQTITVHVKMRHLVPRLVNTPEIRAGIQEAFASTLACTSQQKTLSVVIELRTIVLSDFS